MREVYGLSIQDASDLLGLKSKSNIANWEAAKNIPSLDMLVNIADLFAISTDWILGRSTSTYTEESVTSAENAMIEAFNQTEFSHWENLVDPGYLMGKVYNRGLIPAEYADYEQRKQRYSLGQRANIVFLMRKYWLTLLSGNTDYSVSEKAVILLPNITAFKELKEGITNRRQKKFNENVGKLDKLLRNPDSNPIFDLEKLNEEYENDLNNTPVDEK